jgi:hypothetical protein
MKMISRGIHKTRSIPMIFGVVPSGRLWITTALRRSRCWQRLKIILKMAVDRWEQIALAMSETFLRRLYRSNESPLYWHAHVQPGFDLLIFLRD